MSQTTTQNIKKGFFWNSISQFASSGISFLSIIILSRLLLPEEFALVGMIAIFMAVANMIVDSGMGASLFKKVNATLVDYSTLFYYNLIVSIILYTALYFVAPLIASFYDKTILVSLIRILGLSIIIHAFSIVQSIRLLKELKFKALASINVISGSISLIIAICFAKNGYGVWTLVIQQLCLSVIITSLMCVYNKFSPSVVFSIVSFKEQFAFGINLLFSNLLKTFTDNLNSNVIAKAVPLLQTGYFVQSNRLVTTGTSVISTIIDKTLFPVFSKIENIKELTRDYIRLSKCIFSLSFPISAFVVFMSNPIITLVLGSKWSGATWMLQILSISIIPLTIQVLCRNILKSRANTKQIFYNEVIKSVFVLSFLFVGMLLGLKYILWSIVVAQTCSCLWIMYSVSKEISYTYWSQLKDVLILLIISALSYFFSACIFTAIQSGNNLLDILSGTVLMASFVLFLSYLFKQMEIFKIFRIINKYLKDRYFK